MSEIKIELKPSRAGRLPVTRDPGVLHFSHPRPSRCRRGAEANFSLHLEFQPLNSVFEGCRTRLGLRGSLLTMTAANHVIEESGPTSPLEDATASSTNESS